MFYTTLTDYVSLNMYTGHDGFPSGQRNYEGNGLSHEELNTCKRLHSVGVGDRTLQDTNELSTKWAQILRQLSKYLWTKIIILLAKYGNLVMISSV